MKCAICGRALDKPAVTLGRAAIGPKCAKRAGLIQQKPEASRAERDAATVDWVQEIEARAA